MKVAVISDIHGNLEALEAVESSIRSEGVDRVWCLGDIVGYGPNPRECLAHVRALCPYDEQLGIEPIVLGNHDDAAIGGDISLFNPRAKDAALWTRDTLTEDEKEFLRHRVMGLSINGALLVHASPDHPKEWHYVIGLQEAVAAFPLFREKVCFVGHSHYPFAAKLCDNKVSVIHETEFVLEDGYRYLINVGSVGQPRDRDIRACYVVFDTDQSLIRYVRVEYDIEACQLKIMKAGLPGFLAERLGIGY